LTLNRLHGGISQKIILFIYGHVFKHGHAFSGMQYLTKQRRNKQYICDPNSTVTQEVHVVEKFCLHFCKSIRKDAIGEIEASV
jgi:hypothetical protein